jgi:hypothetical protein
MHVYVCVCIYMCMYAVCVYVHMYVGRMLLFVKVCAYVCMCVYIYYVCVCVFVLNYDFQQIYLTL